MDWRWDTTGIGKWIKKYCFLFLMLLVGFVFLLFPEDGSKKQAPVSTSSKTENIQSLQQQLEELLCHLAGAGNVRVLLTEAQGQQTHYETQQDRRTDGASGELRTETVILTGADRGESGLIRRVDPPVYLGAVVLCQGADSASVRLAIVDAVSAATGLGADKISVSKMK